jgi:hypothetical protein
MTDPTTAEAMVVRALASWGEKQRDVGAEFGVSGATISHIRRGKRYAKVLPELTRWRSCETCHHWEGRCTLGFPEPELLDDLLRVGTECSAYMEARP